LQQAGGKVRIRIRNALLQLSNGDVPLGGHLAFLKSHAKLVNVARRATSAHDGPTAGGYLGKLERALESAQLGEPLVARIVHAIQRSQAGIDEDCIRLSGETRTRIN
jgi:hypothetical protein